MEAIVPVNISIKNVPDDIAEKLRQRAKRAHRSLQGELMVILEQAVQEHQPITLDMIRELVKVYGIRTGDDSVKIIREARNRR